MARCLNFNLADERGNWMKLLTRLEAAKVEIESASLITNDDGTVSVHIAAADPKRGATAEFENAVRAARGDHSKKARAVQIEIQNGTEGLKELAEAWGEAGVNVYQLTYSARKGDRTGTLTATLAPRGQ
jgi:hypothetical protein